MIKEDITYTNYDDQTVTTTLWFHISRVKWLQNLDFQERFKGLEDTLAGETRELAPDEVRRIINLVKDLMKLGYGERTGDEFYDSTDYPEVWERFRRSAAHDAFIWELFKDDAAKSMPWMLSLLPEEIRAEAQAEVEKRNLVSNHVVSGEVTSSSATPKDDRPAWIRENREPTNVEMQKMTKQQLMDAFANKAKN